MRKTRFFCYNQNNSGGAFSFDEEEGITVNVYVEAEDSDDANDRAEEIGLYFYGCDVGLDCECCGDRWMPAYGEGHTLEEVRNKHPRTKWEKEGMEACIHFIDGSKEWGDYGELY